LEEENWLDSRKISAGAFHTFVIEARIPFIAIAHEKRSSHRQAQRERLQMYD